MATPSLNIATNRCVAIFQRPLNGTPFTDTTFRIGFSRRIDFQIIPGVQLAAAFALAEKPRGDSYGN